jgi:hypothetical protein
MLSDAHLDGTEDLWVDCLKVLLQRVHLTALGAHHAVQLRQRRVQHRDLGARQGQCLVAGVGQRMCRA